MLKIPKLFDFLELRVSEDLHLLFMLHAVAERNGGRDYQCSESSSSIAEKGFS